MENISVLDIRKKMAEVAICLPALVIDNVFSCLDKEISIIKYSLLVSRAMFVLSDESLVINNVSDNLIKECNDVYDLFLEYKNSIQHTCSENNLLESPTISLSKVLLDSLEFPVSPESF